MALIVWGGVRRSELERVGIVHVVDRSDRLVGLGEGIAAPDREAIADVALVIDLDARGE